MKKVNFTSLSVRTGIGSDQTTQLNIKESFANMLYTQVSGIAALTLAQKIYKSQGEEEYDDNEYDLIMRVANAMCTPAIIEALSGINN
ncbi:MAG: hypothetical protein ACI4T5_10815 [Prevotella sp.]